MSEALTSEAINSIVELSNEARKTKLLKVEGEPAGHYYLVGPDGKASFHTAKPEWHNEQLDTPVEFLHFIRKYSDSESAVYISDDVVVFIDDQADRRNKATCKLKLSPFYQFLAATGGKPLSQAEFVRALRISLAGCLPAGSGLLDLVRNLKWNTVTDATVDLQHSRQSIARSIIAEVKGIDQIPEEFTLTVPIFENHRYSHPILCAIEVTPSDEKFRLTPYPMQLRQALDAALAHIADLLSGAGEEVDPKNALPPVYRGKP